MPPRSPTVLAAALGAAVAAAALGSCTVVTAPDRPRAAPVGGYAPAQAYPAGAASGRPYDPYCAEAVGEARAAAGQAAVTGAAQDAGRAQRSADYARRDCR
jgi:hypothetical protein